MKRCPLCSQIYTDDLSFCLSDGTPLLALLEEPEQATVVGSGRQKSAALPPASSGLWLKVLGGLAVLFFGSLALGGIALWVFWPRDIVAVPGNGNSSNISTPTPVPTSTRTPTPTPLPTPTRDEAVDTERERLDQERKRLEDERRRLDEENVNPRKHPNHPGSTIPGRPESLFDAAV